MTPASWYELACSAAPGSKVVFVTAHDIFPEGTVPAGATGVIAESGLNEIWGGLLVLLDDPALRPMLAEWDGRVILGQSSGDNLDPGCEDARTDPHWQAASPLAIVEAAPWR